MWMAGLGYRFTSDTLGRQLTRLHKDSRVTLRLERQVMDKLVEEASRFNTSVSALAGRGLRRFVEWDNVSERYGFQTVTREFLAKVMDYVPEEDTRKLGEWMSDNVYAPLTVHFFKKENLENALAVFHLMASYGRRFNFDTSVVGEKCVITLRHDMGPKWSTLYEEVLRKRLEGFLGRGVEELSVFSTTNQVVAEFVTKLPLEELEELSS